MAYQEEIESMAERELMLEQQAEEDARRRWEDFNYPSWTCECGKEREFGAHVFAHWEEPLIHLCDEPNCNRRHRLLRGVVTLIEADSEAAVCPRCLIPISRIKESDYDAYECVKCGMTAFPTVESEIESDSF